MIAPPPTVLIVDDDLRLRASLAQAIRGAADLKLVGEADDLPEELRLVEVMQPDVYWSTSACRAAVV